MLEMFTDNDPMRLDDFKFPADIGYIAKDKRVCYNDNAVGDRPPPIKSEERMKKTLSIEAIVNNMKPLIKAQDFTTYHSRENELMIVYGIVGHQHTVLSITVAHESGRITITYNDGAAPRMLYSEEDLASHRIEFELYVKQPFHP